MAITFRGASADTNPAGTQQFLAVPAPAGVEAGDLLLAFVVVRGGAAVAITAPDGWRLLRRFEGDAISLALYTRRAASEPATWIWTPSSSGPSTGAILAYGNVDRYVTIDAIDAAARSGVAHALPVITASLDGCVLLAAVGAAANTSITLPAEWIPRAISGHTGGLLGSALLVADRDQAIAGASPASSAGTGAITASINLVIALRPSAATMTAESAAAFVDSLMPPGYEELYDLDHEDGIAGILAALGESLREFGFDAHDNLRRELLPATAVSKLAEWEAALGISPDEVNVAATIPARQAQVVGRLRALGGNNARPIVRAVLATLLGYADPGQIEIWAASRAALRQAHTYTDPAAGVSIVGGGAELHTITVPDAGRVSRAGARLLLGNFSATDYTDIVVTLTAPGGRVKTWSTRPPFAAADPLCLFAREFAGDQVGGDWTVSVSSVGGSVSADDVSIFVEGVGRYAWSTDPERQGLGAAVFEWGALIDPALAGARGFALYRAALRMLRVFSRAHVRAYLAYKPAAGGGSAGRYDDTLALYDHSLYG